MDKVALMILELVSVCTGLTGRDNPISLLDMSLLGNIVTFSNHAGSAVMQWQL
jgi:hypothetical protein